RAQAVEVDARQDLELFERDVLVQLVDAGVHRPDLDHLGADVDDEARIRGATGRRELTRAPGMTLRRLEDRVSEAPALAEKRLGTERPLDGVVQAVLA